ncbi:MAG TPA: RNA-binding protein [candidate division Zixibacteria bacterium]|nr:RNA-binding protein [candidate division Zixibacteria bacterium]
MNIYVGNLNFDTTEDELKKAFEQYGQVESVKIISDRYTGRSKGFGFIEMPSDDEGRAAIEGLDGSDFGGRNLKVNEAKPREDRGDRGNRGGGGGRSNRW